MGATLSYDKTSGGQPSSGPEVTPQPGVLAPIDPPPEKAAGIAKTPKGTIKVNVNLVNVLVSVLDEQKRPAPNLPIDAFQILEEGVPQKIEFFEAETKWPLDIALMIDANLSAHMDIQFERSASAFILFNRCCWPEDRLPVHILVRRIGDAADDVYRQGAGAAGSGGEGARLGGHRALRCCVSGFPGAGTRCRRRRAIVLFTDAGETTSRADFETARRAAVRARYAPLYDRDSSR